MKEFRFRVLLADAGRELGFTSRRQALGNFKEQRFIENLDYLVLRDLLEGTEKRFREEYLLSDACLKKWRKALGVVSSSDPAPPSQNPLGNRFNGIFAITSSQTDFVRLEDAYRRLSLDAETKIFFGKSLKAYLVALGWEGQKKRCTHGRFKGEWGFTNLKFVV